MNYKAVIKDAWHLTQENKPLMWWYAFIPELIGLVVGMLYLGYQFMSFYKSPVFHEYEGSSFMHDAFLFVGNFWSDFPSWAIVLVVIAAITILFYFFLPIFCKASLVQLIARMRNGQSVKAVDGVSYGFLHFLPLFEYRLLLRSFSLIGVLTEASFVIRNLGAGAFEILVLPFILVFFIGLLLLLLFTYSEYYIIIDGKGMMKSMGASARLVIRHWQHTLLMFILMLLITLRIFLNIILVLLIPSLIIVSTALLTAVAMAKIGFVVGVVLGIIAMYFAAYLGAILEVFSSSVWVFTFLELTAQGETSAREVGDKGPRWVAGQDEEVNVDVE
ncbi:hypothetical protein HN748_02775 [Candidatus Peregrinibacteria bacterium]|jgi:hypothetical protein|nr:hypothetical protein [Candidatus Peregrinibacteria bacterium]MBT7483284.1 hypothetical protein [Candidatus Peregrinibacteria bacterium]MBT7703131.1 hypothetical protein [Candidatus Peregrinibacteria bacterium]